VYIDPPFNTAASEILYKNNYKHSSWISMMADRIQNAAYLMKSNSVICAAIDDFEISSLTECLSRTFGEDRRLATVAVRSNPHGRAMAAGFSPNHEYALFFGRTESSAVGRLPRDKKKQERYPESDHQGIFAWMNFRATGANSRRADRPKLFYPIFVTEKGDIRVPLLTWSVKDQKWETEEKPHADEAIVFPMDAEKSERVWNLGWERAKRETSSNLLAKPVDGKWQIYRKYRPNQEGALPGTWWEDAKYSATESGTRIIKDLFGERELFAYPKSIYLVEDCLRASNCKSESYVLDFFGGSGTTGHAVMNLNNEDGGKRKFILIEMANYFDTVIIPRIKKVAYSFNWKDGKPQDSSGNGIFFKYQVLEQYEDTLDNLELKENGNALNLFGSDYLLKYFLDFETQDDAAWVNFEQFKQPFSYRLKVNYEEVGEPQEAVVDLPETFHYLLGLKAKKIKVRKDKGRKYLFTLGEREGRNVAVVWREYDDAWAETDFKRDKEFIIQEIEAWAPQVVYVNGQSALTPQIGGYTVDIRAIEPEFRKRMVNA
jgi:adenine-specific DNA-methyltransferase